MRLFELLEGVPHEMVQGGDTQVSSVEIDSRKVREGSFFICLSGLEFDGHDFIPSAAKSGAVAILVEKKAEKKWGEVLKNNRVSVVSVECTRSAMSFVAANFHGNPAKKLRLIGVTGTNGKTTTTHFIDEILTFCGRKTGLIGTVGAKIAGKPLDYNFLTSTTPDPLELHEVFKVMAAGGVQDVIMEVSSHALHFRKMDGLLFDVGVFTNLSQDHLDIHGTMENYMVAKAQLFAKSKTAVINVDDEASKTMIGHLEGRKFLSYGIESDADLRAFGISIGEVTKFNIHGENGPFTLKPKGKFNVYNALAAVGVAKTLGFPMEKIREAVAGLHGVEGRIQDVPNKLGVNIFVDYAHTPDGLVNIISSVREFTKGKITTIVGCGGDRDKLKRPIMGKIAGEMSDYTIITSDNPRTENPFHILSEIEAGVKETGKPYESIENRKTAIFLGVKNLRPGDSLIIAGKGHENYQIIGKDTIHFSDYETAVEAVNHVFYGGTNT